MLVFDGEYPAVQPKAKFWHFFVKNCKKSAVKHSIEKPIFLNFVNFSPTFCPRLYRTKSRNYQSYKILLQKELAQPPTKISYNKLIKATRSGHLYNFHRK